MKKLLIIFTFVLILSAAMYSHIYFSTGLQKHLISTGVENFSQHGKSSLLNELNVSGVSGYRINTKPVVSPAGGGLNAGLNNGLNNTELCRRIWRYSFVCALEYALNDSSIEKVLPLARKLEGRTVQDCVWNVLAWEGKNLKYNWSKATLNPTVIEYFWSGNGAGNGIENVKIVRKGIWYQTPQETVEKGNGICGDYAILTSALLADMNITPYPVLVNFTTGTGHAAVLVKIEGWYFVLDQHLPPMDLGAYYREWKYYRKATFGSRTIKNLHVYVVKPGVKRAELRDLGIIDAKEMLRQDYRITSKDLEALSYSVMQEFEKVGLTPDPALKDLKPGSYLPVGYTSGRYWTFTFPHYADYYNPVFFNQYSRYFFSHIYSGSAKIDAESCNRVWVRAEVNGSNLVFHVLLAKYG